jgi:uncharacterized repeat protein (TIGR03803 family)
MTACFLSPATTQALSVIESVVHRFTNGTVSGQGLDARLVVGADNALYGTTTFGGGANSGTLFKVNPDGSGFQVLHVFGVTTNDGLISIVGTAIQFPIRWFSRGVIDTGGQWETLWNHDGRRSICN